MRSSCSSHTGTRCGGDRRVVGGVHHAMDSHAAQGAAPPPRREIGHVVHLVHSVQVVHVAFRVQEFQDVLRVKIVLNAQHVQDVLPSPPHTQTHTACPPPYTPDEVGAEWWLVSGGHVVEGRVVPRGSPPTVLTHRENT